MLLAGCTENSNRTAKFQFKISEKNLVFTRIIEPEISFCTATELILSFDKSEVSNSGRIGVPEDLDFPAKLYTAIGGRWQYKKVETKVLIDCKFQWM